MNALKINFGYLLLNKKMHLHSILYLKDFSFLVKVHFRYHIMMSWHIWWRQLEVTPCLLAPTSEYSSSVDSDNKENDVSSRTVWSLP